MDKKKSNRDSKGRFEKGHSGKKDTKMKLKPIVEYLEPKLPDMPQILLEKLAKILLNTKNDKLVLDAMKVVLGIEETPDKNVVLPIHLQKLLAMGAPPEKG